jgi:hypothetical protein
MDLSAFALLGILFAAYVVFLALFYVIIRAVLLRTSKKDSERIVKPTAADLEDDDDAEPTRQ